MFGINQISTQDSVCQQFFRKHIGEWTYVVISFALVLLNKVMENVPFFFISCQGTKTVMLLPHTDMIIEQYPKEFFPVH